jgi:hypothetical protein
MPTPEVERALAEGAARSRAAAGAERPGLRVRRIPAAAPGVPAGRLAAWYASLPPVRRKLLVGLLLFLLFDLIAGLAAVTMGTHF